MTEARIFRTGTLRRLTDERFRQHFRALTGVSPLRYQKQLRLQEARQLMLNEASTRGAPAGAWDTRARRNSVASTVGCLVRRLSAMSRACGSLRSLAPPIHVKRSRGPPLVEGVPARNPGEPIKNRPFTPLLGSTSCGNRPVRRATPVKSIKSGTCGEIDRGHRASRMFSICCGVPGRTGPFPQPIDALLRSTRLNAVTCAVEKLQTR